MERNAFRSTQMLNAMPNPFNIHMCDLLFTVESTDIGSYTNDTTPYVCFKDIDLIIDYLQVSNCIILIPFFAPKVITMF